MSSPRYDGKGGAENYALFENRTLAILEAKWGVPVTDVWHSKHKDRKLKPWSVGWTDTVRLRLVLMFSNEVCVLRVDGEVQYAYEVYSGPEARATGSAALRTQNHPRVMLLTELVFQR